MIWLLWALAVAAALALLLVLSRRRRDAGIARFRACDSVLDGAERRWLGILEEAAGPQRRVLPLVPAARVAAPASAVPAPERRLARRRLARTRFSFVVCERESLAVCCVVEPWRPRWSRRRYAIGEICNAAGVALLELPRTPEADSIERVRQRLATVPAAAAAPVCPRCHAPMHLHRGRRGALAGRTYWICSNYPRCRAVAPAVSGPGQPNCGLE